MQNIQKIPTYTWNFITKLIVMKKAKKKSLTPEATLTTTKK